MLNQTKSSQILYYTFILALLLILSNCRIDFRDPIVTKVADSNDPLNTNTPRGSIYGGQRIYISGQNFQTDSSKNRVPIGRSYSCKIIDASSKDDLLVCETSPAFDPVNRWSQKVLVQVDSYSAVSCDQCLVHFGRQYTPVIQQLYPRSIANNQILNIIGIHRAPQLPDNVNRDTGSDIVHLKIGDYTCSIDDIDQNVEYSPTKRSPVICRTLADEAGQYNFLQQVTVGYAGYSLMNYQTSLFTNKNYSIRVIPNITNVSDHQSGQYGRIISVQGTGFTNQSNIKCTFGSQNCEILNVGRSTISLRINSYNSSINAQKGKLSQASGDSSTQQNQYIGSHGFKYTRYQVANNIWKGVYQSYKEIKQNNFTDLIENQTKIITELSSPEIYGEYYVEYIRGYFYAPVSGTYRFTGLGDDQFMANISKYANNTNQQNLQPLLRLTQGAFANKFNPYTKKAGSDLLENIKELENGYYYLEIVTFNAGGMGFYKFAVDTPSLKKNIANQPIPLINSVWQVDEIIIEPAETAPSIHQFNVTAQSGTFRIGYMEFDGITYNLKTSSTINFNCSLTDFRNALNYLYQMSRYMTEATIVDYAADGTITTDPTMIAKRVFTVIQGKFPKAQQQDSSLELIGFYETNLISSGSTSTSYKKIQKHSPRLNGQYTLAFKNAKYGNLTFSLSYNNQAWNISQFLQDHYFINQQVTVTQFQNQAFEDKIHLIVEYIGIYSSSDLTVTDKSISGGVQGTNILFKKNTLRSFNGSNPYFNVVPYDLLRVPKNKPQFSLTINGIPALCSDCSFDFDQTKNYNLQVSSFSGKTLTFAIKDQSGNNIATNQKITAYINGASCDAITLSGNQYSCTFVHIPAGSNKPQIHLETVGFINNANVSPININLSINSFNPSSCSPGGGLQAIIQGSDYPQSNPQKVLIYFCGEIVQKITNVNKTHITFIIPPKKEVCTQTPKVVINDVEAALTFTYDVNLQPNITSLSKTSASPISKTVVKITGEGFGDISTTRVILKNKNNQQHTYDLSIINATSSQIYAIFGGGKTGYYTVVVIVDGKGASNPSLSTNNPSDFAYKIVITNLEPKNGTFGGKYNLSITGQNFGPVASSNTVFIENNGVNSICTILWLNSTNIICSMPNSNSEDDQSAAKVIVTGRIVEESICEGPNCELARTFIYTKNGSVYINAISTNSFEGGKNITLTIAQPISNGFSIQVRVGGVISQHNYDLQNKLSFIYPNLTKGFHDISVKIYKGENVTYASPIGVFLTTFNPLRYDSMSAYSGSNYGRILSIYGNGFPPITDKNWFIYTPCYGNQLLKVVKISSRQMIVQSPVQPTGVSSCAIILSYEGQYRSFSYSYNTTLTPSVQIVTNSVDNYKITSISTTNSIDSVQFVLLNRQNQETSSKYVFDISNLNAIVPKNSTSLPSGTFKIKVHFNKMGYAKVTPENINKNVTTPVADSITVSFTGGKQMSINGSGFVINEPQNNDITVCGMKTKILSVSENDIKIQIPPLITKETQATYNLLNDQVVVGTPIADTLSLAEDGLDYNVNTFYKSSNASCYLGYDFGTGNKVDIKALRYMPSPSLTRLASLLSGSVIEGSNDNITWTNIFVIDSKLVDSNWNYWQKNVNDAHIYQFVRFRHNSLSMCQISGFEITGKVYKDITISDVNNQPCDVEIKNVGVTLAGKVIYSATSTPDITNISPAFGPSVGGETITITGTNFSPDISNNKVFIDGVQCIISFASTTQISCQTGVRRSPPSKGNSFIVTCDNNLAHLSIDPYYYVDRWSSTDTWGGQAVPRQGDSVYVPKGMTLLVDQSTPILYSVIVEGKIKFADEKDMTFDTNYFVINGGQFEAGTQTNRYNHKLTFTLYGDIYDKQLPIIGNKLIGCYNCKFNMHGKERLPTWTDLLKTADKTDTIQLAQEVDWQVGQHIVIASSSFDHNEAQERQIIERINATTFKLNRALQYQHLAAIQKYGNKDFYMRSEVGLLTRNIKVQGDPSSQAKKYGSHLIMVGKQRTGLIGKISYSEFTNCGQPKITGRYCTHFHMAEQVPESYIRGISVHHSYARLLTIHKTFNLLVEKNVGYNIQGHAIFLQDGIQKNNIIQDNLIMNSKSSFTMLQSDTSVASYWITHPYNTVRRNRAAGGDFYGFWYQIVANPTGPSADKRICPRGIQIRQSRDNIAHSNKRFGLRILRLAARKDPCIQSFNQKLIDPYSENPAIQSVFQNYTLWRNQECGFLGEELGFTTIRNFKTIDNKKGGLQFHKTNITKELVVAQDCVMVGYSTNHTSMEFIQKEYRNTRGFIASRTDGLLGKDLYFANFAETMTPLQSCSECWQLKLWVTGGKTTYFKNITYENILGNYIFWEKWRRQIFIDMDGTLTSSYTSSSSQYSPASITPYRNSLLNVTNCSRMVDKDASGNIISPQSYNQWNDSIICKKSVALKGILFTNAAPLLTFQAVDIRVALLQNATDTTVFNTSDESLFSSQIMIVIKPKSRDIKGSWAMPFALGHYYNVHWKWGIQFESMSIDPVYFDWPQSQGGVILRFNCSEYRENFDIRKQFNQTILDPQKNNTNQTGQFTPQSCYNGDYNYNNQTQLLYVCVSGRNKTMREWIHMKPIKCTICPTLADKQRNTTLKYWSDPTIWPNQVIPQQGDDVIIPYDWLLVLDISSNILNNLTIQGILYFDPYPAADSSKKNLTLSAHLILVTRGQIQIGTEDTPYDNYANFVLYGNKQSKSHVLDADNAGNKMLAVSGALKFYGKTNSNVWTKLVKFANKSTNTIEIENAQGFSVGDKIVIAPSFAGRKQFQEHQIETISGNVVTLKANLTYDHYGAAAPVNINQKQPNIKEEVFLQQRAGVGRLNRNIRITKAADDNEWWGCRVMIIGSIPTFINNSILAFAHGHVKFRGVQIDGCGQVDTSYAGLRFQNIGTKMSQYPVQKSEIIDSSIHNCFGICTYIDQSTQITFKNNVFYWARKFLVLVLNVSNYQFTDNLLIGATKRQEIGGGGLADDVACYQQYDQINYVDDNVTVQRNLAQGSQGQGFVFPYTICQNASYYSTINNTAGSCEIAFMFQKLDEVKCLYAKGMIGYGSLVGLQANPPGTHTHLIYQNAVFVDNNRGITLRFGHDIDENNIQLKNSYFNGIQRLQTCPECYSQNRNSYCDGGYAVRMFAATISGQQFPLVKPAMIHDVICTQQSYDFAAFLTNVIFENYVHESLTASYCKNMAVFKRHNLASDGTASHILKNTQCINCDKKAWGYFDRPDSHWRGWFGGCGELDCTGPNNYFVYDTDGKFTGSQSQILANNSWIGKGQSDCEQIPQINGHWCHFNKLANLQYESIADDFNTRIMWPVYLNYTGGTWTSQTNGWKQWKWNGNQPENLRLARFWSVIVLYQTYNLTYSGHPPKITRFQFQNRQFPVNDKPKYKEAYGESNQWAIIRIHYPEPNSKRIVAIKRSDRTNETIVPYMNQTNLAENPTSLKCGANNFYYQEGVIQFLLKSDDGCQIHITSVNSLFITVRLEISVFNFYKNNGPTSFMSNICAFLGIDTGRMKIVGVRQGSLIVDSQIQVEDPNSDIVTQKNELNDLKTKLETGLDGNNIDLGAKLIDYQIEAIVVNEDGSRYQQSSSSSEDTNLPLIIGLSVGGGIMIMIIVGVIAVIVYLIKRRRATIYDDQSNIIPQNSSFTDFKQTAGTKGKRQFIKAEQANNWGDISSQSD